MTSIAPVEYVVIAFPGDGFPPDVAPALGKLVDSGAVRILDLLFVKKAADGSVGWFEYDDLDDGAAFAAVEGDAEGLLADEDARELAEMIDPDTSALVILWEDLWAAELGQAVRAAGGEIIAGERLSHAEVLAALEDIEGDAS